MKILFICTSNTCRSPMAQALFNKKAQERKLPFVSESAGTNAFFGDRASENTIAVMQERGIDISSHRSRRVSEYMEEEYDLFVCMAEEHKLMLKQFIPEEKICLFRHEIWDPYGDSTDIYRLCADKIDREADYLLDYLASVKISPMTEQDIPFIAELEKECFSSPWSEAGLREELTNENAVFFTAKKADRVVGYMGMHCVLDECYIANVAVSTEERRQGIGRQLLGYAEEKAREKECSFISLEVRVSNDAAVSLYESEKYERAGERKNFYTAPTENALIMTKQLKG